MNNGQQHPHELPKTLFRFFMHFIKKQPLAFTVFFLAPITVVLENNAIPYSLKMMVDALGTHPTGDSVFSRVAPALWLGGCSWVGMLIILRLQNWWQGYVIPRFQADIRLAVFDYLSRQSYYYFSNQLAGSLANKLNDLPRALDAMFMLITWYGVACIASVIVALIILYTINIWFSVLLFSWVVFQLLISAFLSNTVDKYSVENAEDKSDLSGKIVDSLSNFNVVKLFSRARDEMTYISLSQNQEVKSNKRLTIYMNVFRLYLDIPMTVMLGLMVYLLLFFWQRGQITLGDLVFIFNVYFAIMIQVWYLCHALAELFRDVGIAKQAIALLSVPIEVQDMPNAKALYVTEGAIEFDHVTFHYKKGKKVFDNKSVVIQPKQKVGLVGHSGSGKTTFIHLILRFFNLDSGSIYIDGQDISQVMQDSLRAQISLIPQDITLFHRSLMENIRYGNPTATDAEVIAASKKAFCDQFISLLPDGYQTMVGERGTKLSGGQRQRIAIARAVLKNASIIILDEATSNLDSITEEAIHNSLWDLMDTRTTIVIAHRLSTLLYMDRILVFEEGKIVEDGTHNELMALNGLYKSMWDAQVGGFLSDCGDVDEDIDEEDVS
jgi:ATP-binding cassette, subfamily B, bacterial